MTRQKNIALGFFLIIVGLFFSNCNSKFPMESESEIPCKSDTTITVNGDSLLRFEFRVIPDSAEAGQPVCAVWTSNADSVSLSGIKKPPSGNYQTTFDTSSVGKKIIFVCTAYKGAQIKELRDTVFITMPEPPDTVKVPVPVPVPGDTVYAPPDTVEVPVEVPVPGDTAFIEPDPPLDVEPISIPMDNWLQPDSEISVSIDIGIGGYYRIFANVFYSTMANESFYLEVQLSDGSIRGADDPNAGNYRVVPDDSSYSGVLEKSSGIFRMTRGQNIIRIRHYNQIAEYYPYYIQDGGITPVHIIGLWLEFVGRE